MIFCSRLLDMITWCTRVISCYCLSQSTVVAPHIILHSLHQFAPCRLPKPLHLKNGGKKKEVLLLSTSTTGYHSGHAACAIGIPLGADQKNVFSGEKLHREYAFPSLYMAQMMVDIIQTGSQFHPYMVITLPTLTLYSHQR